MFRSILWIVGGTIVLMATVVSADTLLLKDGRVLTGTYKSGSANFVEFEIGGKTNTYPVESIVSLTFERSAPSVSSKPASSTGPVTVNAGTQLMVRTETNLITGKLKKGDRFTALLEANLVVNGQVIIARGSSVYGRVVESKEAKRVVGVAKLVIELTDIKIGGQLHPVVTDRIAYVGERSGTLKKIAVGAAAGAAIDGKKGAKTGAKVGAGAAVLTKGKQITIPAKSLLAFRMMQPLQVNR